MRHFLSFVLAAAIPVALLAACNSNDSAASKGLYSDPGSLTTQTPSDGVRRITVPELKDAVDKNAVLIIDARGPDQYAVEHIKGSINILEGNLDTYINSLPRDKMIVTYCS
jgi:3-mercaptopyruvate sulfurtransferase SseA